jgi:hypothetical protein
MLEAAEKLAALLTSSVSQAMVVALEKPTLPKPKTTPNECLDEFIEARDERAIFTIFELERSSWTIQCNLISRLWDQIIHRLRLTLTECSWIITTSKPDTEIRMGLYIAPASYPAMKVALEFRALKHRNLVLRCGVTGINGELDQGSQLADCLRKFLPNNSFQKPTQNWFSIRDIKPGDIWDNPDQWARVLGSEELAQDVAAELLILSEAATQPEMLNLAKAFLTQHGKS